MKRKYLLALSMLLSILAVIDLPRLMSACPGFPDAATCGDPTSIGSCNPTNHPCTCGESGCHGGTILASSANTLSILIVDSAAFVNGIGTYGTIDTFQYTPGITYLVAFELNSPPTDTNGMYGFEMTALNDAVAPDTTTMAGYFGITDPTHTFVENRYLTPYQYISHKNASSFLNWGFTWTAPATTMPVTFYYTYNFSTSAFRYDSICGGAPGCPGGQIYEGNVTIQSTVSGINDIAGKVTNVGVFPNPATDQFNLSFTLKQSSPISLSVYSVDGKMVQQLMQNETKDAGYFNSSFDISNLAAGIYLAKLSVGGASITKKIIKL